MEDAFTPAEYGMKFPPKEEEGDGERVGKKIEIFKQRAKEAWKAFLEARKYKRLGQLEVEEKEKGDEVEVPCTGSVALDAIGFKMFSTQYIEWLYKAKKSDIVGLGVGFGSVFVKDPNLFREVVLQDPKAVRFDKTGEVHELIRETVGAENIVEESLEDGDKFHGALRKATAPFATIARHEALYSEIMQDNLGWVERNWTEAFNRSQNMGEVAQVDAALAMKRFTMMAVTEALFGVEDLDKELYAAGINGFDELKGAIRTSAERISKIVGLGGAYKDPVMEEKYNQAVVIIDKYAAHVDQYSPDTHRNGEATFKQKLHEMFPDVPGNEEMTLENQRIRRAQIKGMTIAGFETTAPTLLHALFMLQQHPDIEREAYKAVINGDTQYLKDLWKETTRDSAGIPMLSRTAAEDQTLTTTIKGEPMKVRINKGDYVSISVDAANHDPKYWPKIGPSVKEFNPDRWAIYRAAEEKLRTKGQRLKTGYLTFGGGPTGCLGEKFSEAEGVELFIYYLKQPYKLQFVDEKGPDLNRDWIIAESNKEQVMGRLIPRDPGEFLDIKTSYELEGPRIKPKKFNLSDLDDVVLREDIEDDKGEKAPKCPFHKIFPGKKKAGT